MNIDSFLLMRHEIILTMILLLVLLAEIFAKDKNTVLQLALALFVVHTIIGFFPQNEGSLFGQMYRTNGLCIL